MCTSKQPGFGQHDEDLPLLKQFAVHSDGAVEYTNCISADG